MESTPAVFACSAYSVGFLFACHSAFAMSTAHLSFLPPFILLCPISFHVRQDRHKLLHRVCKLRDCPVGSNNAGLQ